MILTSRPTFRLLDPYVGWEANRESRDSYIENCGIAACENIEGLDDEYGLRIGMHAGNRVSRASITQFISPAWIDQVPASGDFVLCGHSQGGPILRQRTACAPHWIDLMDRLDRARSLCHPVALAVDCRRVAVVDGKPAGDGGKKVSRLLIWSIPDGARLCERIIPFDQVNAVAFAPWGEILVVATPQSAAPKKGLYRLDYSGNVIESLSLPAPQGGAWRAARLGRGNSQSLWLALEPDKLEGHFDLWEITLKRSQAEKCREKWEIHQRPFTDRYYPDVEKELAQRLPPSGILAEQGQLICLHTPNSGRESKTEWIDSLGNVSSPPISTFQHDVEMALGTYQSGPIDSGIKRCRWHRIRIEGDFPADSHFHVEIATTDDKECLPHTIVRQTFNGSPKDLLIDQPPGQYLFLRLDIHGRSRSPVIRRIRIDFPRITGLDQLPAVYREDPDAESFTERFLSLFDAAIEDLDDAMHRLPALLASQHAPAEVLPWLGRFLGVVCDGGWSVAQQRALLGAAPQLFRDRGTCRGLISIIRLAMGMTPVPGNAEPEDGPVIQEGYRRRRLGVVTKSAQLGTMCLFGRTTSRFRVGSSAVGSAPLRVFGNAAGDPLRIGAHQFEVLLPPGKAGNIHLVERIERLIESQKPAHTQHQVRMGGEGFILGHRSVIGIDTKLVSPPQATLGGGDEGSAGMRLGEGILASGPHRPTSGLRLEVASTIGIHTTLE